MTNATQFMQPPYSASPIPPPNSCGTEPFSLLSVRGEVQTHTCRYSSCCSRGAQQIPRYLAMQLARNPNVTRKGRRMTLIDSFTATRLQFSPQSGGRNLGDSEIYTSFSREGFIAVPDMFLAPCTAGSSFGRSNRPSGKGYAGPKLQRRRKECELCRGKSKFYVCRFPV